TLIDLYRDGRADLVIGAPWDGTEGLITLLRATSSGLTSSSAKTISGGSVGLTGSGPGIGSSAYFGWDLVHWQNRRPSVLKVQPWRSRDSRSCVWMRTIRLDSASSGLKRSASTGSRTTTAKAASSGRVRGRSSG